MLSFFVTCVAKAVLPLLGVEQPEVHTRPAQAAGLAPAPVSRARQREEDEPLRTAERQRQEARRRQEAEAARLREEKQRLLEQQEAQRRRRQEDAERRRQDELRKMLQVAQEKQKEQVRQWRSLQEKSLKQRSNFWCPVCQETVSTVAKFHHHLMEVHQLGDDHEDLVWFGGRFRCVRSCGKTWKSHRVLCWENEEPLLPTQIHPQKCRTCSTECFAYELLCPDCGKKVPDECLCEEEEDDETEDDEDDEEDDDQEFRELQEKSLRTGKDFWCPLCRQTFATVGGLQRHLTGPTHNVEESHSLSKYFGKFRCYPGCGGCGRTWQSALVWCLDNDEPLLPTQVYAQKCVGCQTECFAYEVTELICSNCRDFKSDCTCNGRANRSDDDEAKPHKESLCARCKYLGEPCWKQAFRDHHSGADLSSDDDSYV